METLTLILLGVVALVRFRRRLWAPIRRMIVQ